MRALDATPSVSAMQGVSYDSAAVGTIMIASVQRVAPTAGAELSHVRAILMQGVPQQSVEWSEKWGVVQVTEFE